MDRRLAQGDAMKMGKSKESGNEERRNVDREETHMHSDRRWSVLISNKEARDRGVGVLLSYDIGTFTCLDHH